VNGLIPVASSERFTRTREACSWDQKASPCVLAWIASVLIMVIGLPSLSQTPRPCDIYANAGTACVAAHSTTRALYAAYNGPLYQVRRSSDGNTQDIGVLTTGDYANAAVQDSFCADTSCIIARIYDQSPRHNDLTIEGPGEWCSRCRCAGRRASCYRWRPPGLRSPDLGRDGLPQ
jgi:hypothetical protein